MLLLFVSHLQKLYKISHLIRERQKHGEGQKHKIAAKRHNTQD
jgi:hypothetical protein